MVQSVIYWLLLTKCVFGSQSVFSVYDDVFAYPQYAIDFSTSYILEEDAATILHASKSKEQESGISVSGSDTSNHDDVTYERMTLYQRGFLCAVPHVKPATNITEEKPSKEDQKKELINAADRGWQLLQDMEGKQCLYYTTGWWSYAFCYNSYVKQFHALPPASGGQRPWPPKEDESTPSYILGKYQAKSSTIDASSTSKKREATEVQTRADGNYLVQRLEGGTPCDLTGKNRRIEVEFHCHPQTTDRIGWIKETTTCAYLMVIYTPRLCNDVTFQLTRDSKAHTISCQEILTPSEVARLKENEQEPTVAEKTKEQPVMVGGVEFGAKKHVGKDGKTIERGRIVMTPEERAETIMLQKDGQIQSLSKRKMKEFNLEPEDIENLKKQFQRIAGSKDGRVDRVDNGEGPIELRVIIAADDSAKGDQPKTGDEKTTEKEKEKEKQKDDGKDKVSKKKEDRKDEL